MLYCEDPDFISSLTLAIGARGLLLGAPKANSSPGLTCVVPWISSHRAGALWRLVQDFSSCSSWGPLPLPKTFQRLESGLIRAIASTANSLVRIASDPMDTYGQSSLEVSNSVFAYCWSSLPPMLPLSTEVWSMCLVKTGSKKAWSISALPVSTVTESPSSVAVFCGN